MITSGLALLPMVQLHFRADPNSNYRPLFSEAVQQLHTRIAESMTEYRCGNRIGYGMSEYLDQIVDGEAVGRRAG